MWLEVEPIHWNMYNLTFDLETLSAGKFWDGIWGSKVLRFSSHSDALYAVDSTIFESLFWPNWVYLRLVVDCELFLYKIVVRQRL